MVANSKKNIFIYGIIVSLIVMMMGCSKKVDSIHPTNNGNFNKSASENVVVNDKKSDVDSSNTTSTNLQTANNKDSDKAVSSKDDSKVLLDRLLELSKQGKIINSEFAAKITVIEDVKKKWGEPDKTEWIPAAKGMYVTYSKHDVVFGFNKGSQIFEVRSFDDNIKKIHLSKVKELFGVPSYDVKVNGEEIVGYVSGKEFKLLLVFREPSKNNPDPLMDHYSVLYPQGTVNMMADDPGRQW